MNRFSVKSLTLTNIAAKYTYNVRQAQLQLKFGQWTSRIIWIQVKQQQPLMDFENGVIVKIFKS